MNPSTETTPQDTPKMASWSSIIKNIVVVIFTLLVIRAGLAYPWNLSTASNGSEAVKSVTILDVEQTSNHESSHHHHHQHLSHSHAEACEGLDAVEPVVPKRTISTRPLFSSKRNIIIMIVVVAAVALLAAAGVTAAVVLLSMPSEPVTIITPDPEENIVDNSPQAVAERSLADLKASVESGIGLFWGAVCVVAVLVLILSTVYIGSCFCIGFRSVDGWKSNVSLIVGAIAVVASGITLASLAYVYPDMAQYYSHVAGYFVAAAFIAVAGVLGGPIALGVSLSVLSVVTIVLLFVGALQKRSGKEDQPMRLVDFVSDTLKYDIAKHLHRSRAAVIILSLVTLLSAVITVIAGQFDPVYYALSVIPVIACFILIFAPGLSKSGKVILTPLWLLMSLLIL